MLRCDSSANSSPPISRRLTMSYWNRCAYLTGRVFIRAWRGSARRFWTWKRPRWRCSDCAKEMTAMANRTDIQDQSKESRRNFLRAVGAGGAATVAAIATQMGPGKGTTEPQAQSASGYQLSAHV